MQQRATPSRPNQPVYRTVLDNGIVVIAVENPSADIVAGRIYLRTGGRCESREQAGLSHLLSSVLTKGTLKLSSQEIAERVESVGASLGTDAASDYFVLSMKTVSADFADIFQLAGEILRSPTFPEAEVELERRLTLQDISSQQEQPFTIAFDQLRQAMYQNHPYALSSLGTEASVAQLSRTDLQRYHQTYFRPDQMVISLAGQITPEEAVEAVNQVFGDWHNSADIPTLLQLPIVTPNPIRTITSLQTQQSIVMLGYQTPSVQEADYTALKVLNTYLGNGLSSRLFVELREKRGLAYDVSAFYPTRLDTSLFVVYIGTAPENTAIALEGLQVEVERLCTNLLSADELQAAKNKLLGQYALGKQTNAQLAQIYGWYETIGLGIEFDTQFQQNVANVTPEMAQSAARRYFIEPYISLVGPDTWVNAIAAPAVC